MTRGDAGPHTDGNAATPALSIGDVAAKTGLAPATVRVWEARHGFPRPSRLASGHRRYSERDVNLLREVVRARDEGLAVEAAIARAMRWSAEPEPSIFAGLRRRRPGLPAHVLRKWALTALSNAIEDEYCARAERAVLFGAFQAERFYRRAEPRWRDLARTAEAAIVFADFAGPRTAPGAPVEVPLGAEDPLTREWALVCDSPGYAACLAAWELPGEAGAPDRERRFETIWSVDRRVVRDAARMGAGLLAGPLPELARRLTASLEDAPRAPAGDDLDALAALTRRMVAYVASAST